MAYPISDVTRRVQYTGSAGVGPYSFTFEILAQTDIAVYKNSTLLTLTTNYTVTINGDGTGSITLTSAATGTDTITIVGDRAIARTTDFVTGGDLLANSLNEELDAQTIFSQQLQEQLNRTLRYSPSSNVGVSLQLPTPDPAKVLAWNVDGTAIENVDAAALAQSIVGASYTAQTLSGTGSQTVFTLSSSAPSSSALDVFISGVRQTPTTDYSVTGTTLTFVVAPPSGTNNILAIWVTAIPAVSDSTLTQNLTFTGTGNRITGDFSNATIANRVMFQTTLSGGNTVVGAIPNGAGNVGGFNAYNSSDPTNASFAQMAFQGAEARFTSGLHGTGTYLPMTFYTGGAERMRIDTSGNVGIGSAPVNDFDVIKTKPAANVIGRVINIDSGASSGAYQFVAQGAVNVFTAALGNAAGYFGTASNHPMYFYTNNALRMSIDTSGNVLVTGSGGGLGYGTGSGGTVTQATSKSTAVTLNKPTGIITMNNASLAANTAVQFTFNNSLLTGTDVLLVTLGASGITPSAYTLTVQTASGLANIVLRNHSAGALAEAVAINFVIIKGAAA